MSKFETIRFENDSRNVAVITLARQQFHNAINSTMITELTQTAQLVRSENSIRVCTLQSEGDIFCAGRDLTFMQSQMDLDHQQIKEEARRITDMLSALDDLPCPLIAKVQGPAYGGGIGLLVCAILLSQPTVPYLH